MSLMPFMWIFETSFKDLYYCNQVHRFKGLIFSCLCLVLCLYVGVISHGKMGYGISQTASHMNEIQELMSLDLEHYFYLSIAASCL